MRRPARVSQASVARETGSADPPAGTSTATGSISEGGPPGQAYPGKIDTSIVTVATTVVAVVGAVAVVLAVVANIGVAIKLLRDFVRTSR